MNNKEVLDFILEVESQLKEIDVRYERYFLLIRVFLYGSFRSNTPVLITFKNRIKAIVKGSVDVFFLRKKFRLENLIVSPSSHFNNNHNGLAFSKHVEAIKSKIFNYDVILTGNNLNSKYLNVSSIPSALYKVKAHFRKRTTHNNIIYDFSSIIRSVALSKNIKLNFNPNDLLELISKIESHLYFYEKIIPNKVMIKKVIFVAYYNINDLAMIEVLKRRGVECIDYQHGIQNNYHPMYSYLSGVSSSIGIPTTFWGWDGVSKKRIVSELGYESFELVGNLWYGTKLYKEVLNKLQRSKKTILVALQLWPDYFNFELLDVIRKDTDYLWVFREHPLNRISLDEKNSILKNNVDIIFEDINTISVETSINSCDICITGYSTVGIEAHHMGKKIIFVHENAKFGLSDYINKDNDIFYADTSEMICSILAEDV